MATANENSAQAEAIIAQLAELRREIASAPPELKRPLFSLLQEAHRQAKEILGADALGALFPDSIDVDLSPSPEELLAAAARHASPMVVVRQHAVGHGGFHIGALGVSRPVFRWVYDCGAWRKAGKKALAAKLAAYGPGRPRIDYLFLSHFDADHVSGVEALLACAEVDTIILPYLGKLEAFGILAQARMTGGCSAGLVSAALDPAGWLGKSVRRIIRLRPGASEDGLPTPRGLPEFTPRSADDYSPVTLDSVGEPLLGTVGAGDPEEIIAEPGLRVGVMGFAGELIDWGLLPFTHPISSDARRVFEKGVAGLIGVHPEDPEFPDALRKFITDNKSLSKLRKTYRVEELSDANGISLSLYAGPMWPGLRRNLNVRSRNYASGWLLTGDAKLASRYRREAWLCHYANVPNYLVGWLMLPHHGSAGNFHADILTAAPSAEVFLTADTEDLSRPNEEIRDHLKAQGKGQVWKITELQETELIEISGAPEFAGWNFPGRQPVESWV